MGEISIRAEEIMTIAGFPVTNALLLSYISVGFLATVGILFNSRIALVPGIFQGIIEYGVNGLFQLVRGVLQDDRKARTYFPLIATVFFFILCSNLLGLLPGIGSVGIFHTVRAVKTFIPLFRSPASDLNFTLALAIVSVISINFFGVLAVGFFKHISRFFTVRNPIDFFIGILEFISEIAKIISFSFRLFGNVFAGEVLLTIIAFLVPYFIPLPFLLLELFVGFIQATVFAMLTLVFVSVASSETH